MLGVEHRMAHLVVTYHYVRPRNSDGVTGITPAEFAEQIRMIRRTHRIVGVEEYLALREDEGNLALLTFDDAVRDQWEYAAPVMEEMGVPSVLFAPMRPFADKDEIARYDAAAGRPPLPVEKGSDAAWCVQHLLHALAQELGWEEFERRVDAELRGDAVVVDAARMDRLYHYEVAGKRRLKYIFAFALGHERASEVLHRINASVGMRAADWFCTREQLSAMQASGHALGGHGFDHVAYTTLTPARQHADMEMAASVMTRLFGARQRAIAYPFGQHDAETVRLATELGYSHQFDTTMRVDAKFLAERLGDGAGVESQGNTYPRDSLEDSLIPGV